VTETENMPSSLERRKDTVQVAIESGATHIGAIMVIVAHAVRDVTRELGDWATDVFEMNEASHRAAIDDETAEADAVGPEELRIVTRG
jgi:hypothetical protein